MVFISEEKIESLLNWDDALKATEASMKAVSAEKVVASQRVFSQIFDSPKWMITMSGYLDDEKYGGWVCKILSGNTKNEKRDKPVPNLNANITLFNQETGALKAVLSGIQITNWRTAAASAVATKHLYMPNEKPQKVLSIFGCGDIGRAHAECFYHAFEFEEIRLWNRTTRRATNLAQELNQKFNTSKFKVFEDKEGCVKGADVIITATNPSPVPLFKYAWLKKGVHINAVGVVGSKMGEKNFELDEETYKHAHIYVDSWAGANKELVKLEQYQTEMKAEVGEIILGKSPTPNKDQLTVFQSLGMAVEDCAVASAVYNLYIQNGGIKLIQI